MWGVPEEETLSWDGEESRREVKSLPAALAGSPSPPHPSSAIIHNPPDPGPSAERVRAQPCLPQGTPGGQSGKRSRHRHTHTLHSSVRPNPDVLISQATEKNREGSWPSKSSRSRGETGWEETSAVPDPKPHGVGARQSACAASDMEPGRELKGCRNEA